VIFRENETIILHGDLYIDRETLETILYTQANSCLVNNVIDQRYVLVRGKNSEVEELLYDPGHPEILYQQYIIGCCQDIYHFKKETYLHLLSKEFLEKYETSIFQQNTSYIELLNNYTIMLNKVIKKEGMNYTVNKGFCLNLNTDKDYNNVLNYTKANNH
jgi:hypothetical protein